MSYMSSRSLNFHPSKNVYFHPYSQEVQDKQIPKEKKRKNQSKG